MEVSWNDERVRDAMVYELHVYKQLCSSYLVDYIVVRAYLVC